MINILTSRTFFVSTTYLLVAGFAALADAGHGDRADIGQAGDISTIDRVIEVDMGEMYFEPGEYQIEKGATVKFVVSNTGRVVHEFAIGTDVMHDSHANEMRAMTRESMIRDKTIDHGKMIEAGIMHLDGNSRLLESGKTVEMIWTFSGEAENLLVACTVPGHREAGMEATITLTTDI